MQAIALHRDDCELQYLLSSLGSQSSFCVAAKAASYHAFVYTPWVAINVNPFTPLNNPLDCFVPAASAFTLCLASSRTAGARLRHVASQALRAIRLRNGRKDNCQG